MSVTKTDIGDCLKHGYPKETESASGYRIDLEFQGPMSILRPAKPALGTVSWEGYTGEVTDSVLEPLEGCPEEGLLRVTTQQNYSGANGNIIGTAQETTYEIEWVPVSKNVFEHPEFRRSGGSIEINDSKVMEVMAWRDETDLVQKKLFKYWVRDSNNNPVSLSSVLTGGQLTLAYLFLRGVEFYDVYAPVVRKTTTYSGGVPDVVEAGFKDTPTGFPRLPRIKRIVSGSAVYSDYEWLKTADRGVRTNRQSRWNRVEEWTGAEKILLDAGSIYVP